MLLGIVDADIEEFLKLIASVDLNYRGNARRFASRFRLNR